MSALCPDATSAPEQFRLTLCPGDLLRHYEASPMTTTFLDPKPIHFLGL